MFEKIEYALEMILVPFKDIECLFDEPFIDTTRKEKESFLINRLLKNTTLKNIDNAKLLIEKYYGNILDIKENNMKILDKYQEILMNLSECFITVRDGEV